MKGTLHLILLLLLSSTQLTASLDTCYQVVEVVESNGSLDVDDRIALDRVEMTVTIDDEPFTWSDTETYQTGDRESLILHFDCLYPFDRFEERGIFTASTLTVASLGQVIICTHHQSEIAYLIIDGRVYLVVACERDDECISPRYHQPIVPYVDYTLTAVPQGAEFEVSPPIIELVSEQVLVQEASSILTIVDHVYELVTEQRAKLYTNLCPDVEAIPMVVEQEVLVREGSSQLMIHPAEFELVTEEVLETAAYTDVERVTVPNWDESYHLSLVPEYFSYDWIGQPSCLSDNPYDCVEVYTSQSPEQVQEISNPAEWDCGQAIDYSEQMLLVTEVPATYSRRSYFKLKVPTTTSTTPIPSETKTWTYTTFENLSTIPDSCIQITYETDTLYRLAAPVTTTYQEIPAVYQTRQYLRTIQDGTYALDLPQTFCEFNFNGQRMIQPAMTTYESYLCAITDVERQEAIKLSLHQVGALADLSFAYGSAEFWIALFNFQNRRDDWDIGPLTEYQAQFLDRP